MKCKFHRQYSAGSFVLDFFAAEIKMGIELDGDSHFQSGVREYDQKRQQFIDSFESEIVRILNIEIYQNLDGVLDMIGREGADEEIAVGCLTGDLARSLFGNGWLTAR
jgi:very-short-patch-repair endonuclease